MVYGQQGQTRAVISDSRSRHGLPPLGVCEQAPLVAPVTSEVSTKEGTATKYHLLLLSLPWECICPSGATAKHSGYCLHLPGRSPPLPRTLQLGAACATFPWVLTMVKGPLTRHWLLALSTASNYLESCTAPHQGDYSLHTLRKETEGNQTKISPHAKNK